MITFTSLKEKGLNILYVILATLISINTMTFAEKPAEMSFPGITYSPPPTCETAIITGPTNACVNSILTFNGNGNENNQHYVWTVDGASIIYGAGTNEIQLRFTTPGTKNITLQFEDNQGCSSTVAQLTVVVANPPTFTPITTSVVCEGSVNGLTVPTITGTYIAGTEFWSLDGVEIPTNYKWKYDNDHGKLLQYNVKTVGCDIVSSAGVVLTVNKKPTITSISVSPTSFCGIGSSLDASVTAIDNGSTITGYEWWIGETMVGTSDNLTYTVSLSDNGKAVKVKVFNSCGADSTTHTIKFTAGTTITTLVNDSVKAISPRPEGFMIQPVTAETKRELPEKYWENPTYMFVTKLGMANFLNYTLNQTVYLKRDNDGIWSVSANIPSGTYYTATVKIANTIQALPLPLDNAKDTTVNTTVVLDNGSIPMGISTALQRHGLKIFGLGPLGGSIIQGQTNEPNYIRAKNLVLENLVFDGLSQNPARTTHFIRVQDEGYNASNIIHAPRRADFAILKNISIRNVNQDRGGTNIFNYAPRGIFNVDDNNGYYEDNATSSATAIYNPSYNITERYFVNITIEASCQLSNSTYTFPILCNSTRYNYFENFNIETTNAPTPVWIMQARSNSSQVTNSSGSVPTGVEINGLTTVADGIFVHMYQSKNIILPNDYRFLRFNTTNGTVNSATAATTAATAYKALPVAAANYAYYDRNDGYWIVRDGGTPTITQQLSYLSTIYARPNSTSAYTNMTPLPPLNIKVIKNSSGTINGFTVPNFVTSSVILPVNIVAVDDIDTPVDKAGAIIPYAGEAPKIVLTATNAPYINFSNFDFTENVSYYIDTVETKISRSLPGNFYHCNFLKDKYESDELLLLNVAQPEFAFADTIVCTSDFFDLKNLVLISGDTTGLTLKYYVNNVELTNTVISTLGTTAVSIVGTSAGGCSYTTSVNVTIETIIFAFADTTVCTSDFFDLKNLVLVSGDTTGLTLKYYVNNVELTNTVISALGTTTVSIVGTSAGGCSYTTSVNVTIETIIFAFADATVCAPDVFDLKNLVLVSGDTTGLILKYYVNNVELTNTVISALGTTTVSIVGTSAGGCSYTTSVDVTINTSKTPVITGPILVYVGAEFKYHGDGADYPATNYYWNTKSGTILNGQGSDEVGISWDTPGIDVISLTYSTGACRNTGTLEVRIMEKEGIDDAYFAINNPTQCLSDNTYEFTNHTIITPPNELISYLWDFGDRSTSTETNPTHKYQQGGVYTVTLIAYSTLANDTISRTVRVLAPYVERPADQVVCANNPTKEVIFRGTADSYSWKNSHWIGLEDGSDPIRIPSFIAKNDKNYPVTDTITIVPMTSFSSVACYGDTVKFLITVNPAIVPTISGPSSICSDTDATYTTETGMSNYNWNVSGGQVVAGGGSNDNYITIRWGSSSKGSVSVHYTEADLCSTSDATVMYVTIGSKASIISQPSGSISICTGDPLVLDVIVSGTGLTYQWYLNGKAIIGATEPEYYIPSGKSSDSGDYYLVINGPCDTLQSATSSVSVSSFDVIVQKWENVLAVKCVPSENGGYEFAAFQWYKNGNLMQGETKSYLYISGVIDYSAIYVVKLTTVDGKVLYTCGRTFVPKNLILVNPYPNPIGKGQALNVDISGVSESTAVDWVLTDYKGVILQKQSFKGSHTTITMPGTSGIYILRVNIGTPEPESKYFKIMVN